MCFRLRAKNHHQKSKLSCFLCSCPILFEYTGICMCVCMCVCFCVHLRSCHKVSLSKQNEHNLRKTSIKKISDSLPRGHQYSIEISSPVSCKMFSSQFPRWSRYASIEVGQLLCLHHHAEQDGWSLLSKYLWKFSDCCIAKLASLTPTSLRRTYATNIIYMHSSANKYTSHTCVTIVESLETPLTEQPPHRGPHNYYNIIKIEHEKSENFSTFCTSFKCSAQLY